MSSWIKAESATPNKPEVFRLAQILGMDDPDLALGKLWRFWAWADATTKDGSLDTPAALIDRVVYCPGFTAALVAVGWLEETEQGYQLPNFDRHNGASSKARALEAEAQRLRRGATKEEKEKKQEKPCQTVSDNCQTKCQTKKAENVRPDKIREEKNIGREITTVDSTPCNEPSADPPLPASLNPVGERLNDVRGVACADNHPDLLGASPGAARFLAASLAVNPSWNRTLPTAVEQAAALEAYRSAQGRITPRDMELLRDFYASEMSCDRRGRAFWRPESRQKFWACFGDVLTHADRWAKETRWKPASERRKKKSADTQPQTDPDGDSSSTVDCATAAAEIRALNEEMDGVPNHQTMIKL